MYNLADRNNPIYTNVCKSLLLRSWKQTQNYDYSDDIHLAKTKSIKCHKLWIFYDRNFYHSVSKQDKLKCALTHPRLSIASVLVVMVNLPPTVEMPEWNTHSSSPQSNRPITKLLLSQKMLNGLIMELRSLSKMLKVLLLTS